jgi:hypothetical protein
MLERIQRVREIRRISNQSIRSRSAACGTFPCSLSFLFSLPQALKAIVAGTVLNGYTPLKPQPTHDQPLALLALVPVSPTHARSAQLAHALSLALSPLTLVLVMDGQQRHPEPFFRSRLPRRLGREPTRIISHPPPPIPFSRDDRSRHSIYTLADAISFSPCVTPRPATPNLNL